MLINQFPTPQVAISTEIVVIHPLGTGIFFDGEWLEYQQEYFVEHFSGFMLRLIQMLLRNIVKANARDWPRRKVYQ